MVGSGLNLNDGNFIQSIDFDALVQGCKNHGVNEGYEVVQSGTGALVIKVGSGYGFVAGSGVGRKDVDFQYLTLGSGGDDARYELIYLGSTGSVAASVGTESSTNVSINDLPNDAVPLAAILIGSGVQTIVDADIRDTRVFVDRPYRFIGSTADADTRISGVSTFTEFGSVVIGPNQILSEANLKADIGWGLAGGGGLSYASSFWFLEVSGADSNTVIAGSRSSNHDIDIGKLNSDTRRDDSNNAGRNKGNFYVDVTFEPTAAQASGGFVCKFSGRTILTGGSNYFNQLGTWVYGK